MPDRLGLVRRVFRFPELFETRESYYITREPACLLMGMNLNPLHWLIPFPSREPPQPYVTKNFTKKDLTRWLRFATIRPSTIIFVIIECDYRRKRCRG